MKLATLIAIAAIPLAGCQATKIGETSDSVTYTGIRLPTLKSAQEGANAHCAKSGKVAKAQNHYAMSIDGIVTFKCE